MTEEEQDLAREAAEIRQQIIEESPFYEPDEGEIATRLAIIHDRRVVCDELGFYHFDCETLSVAV